MYYFTCSSSATLTTIICIIFYICIVRYIIYIVFAKFYATRPLANNSCVYTVLPRIYHLYLISTLRDYAITGVVSFQFDRWGNWNMNRMSWHAQCLMLVKLWNTQSQLPLQGPFPPPEELRAAEGNGLSQGLSPFAKMWKNMEWYNLSEIRVQLRPIKKE